MLDFRANPVAAPIARVLGVNGSEVILIANGWFDSLVGALYLAALLAIVIMGPVTVYLIYRYVEPGLHEHEKRAVKKYLVVIFFLFTAGIVYAYYVIMPIMFAVAVWLTVIGGAKPIFSIQTSTTLSSSAASARGSCSCYPSSSCCSRSSASSPRRR